MMMQQKQQDELQQQVSSGSSLNTSLSSEATEQGREPLHDSSGSNTPSPPPQEDPNPRPSSSGPTSAKASPELPPLETGKSFAVPIGPVGPTSPVLVSQTGSTELKKPTAQSKPQPELQVEQLNMKDICVD